MANQVPIFQFEYGDTFDSINKLKAELKETRKLFEQAKPNTEDFVKYGTEVKRLDSTIKTLNNATKDNVNALGGINQAAKFASGSYGELKQRIEAQKKALLELNTESNDFAATQQGLIKLQEQRIEIEKKIPSLFQERIKGAIDESNSLKQLKADLKAAQSAALNGDGKAAQKVAELKDKIDDLKDSTKSLQGSGVERLNTSMQLLTQGFADFDADKVKTGFKGIGAAMSAIPIILIIEGIKALIENFDAVVKFAKELTGVVDQNALAVERLTTQIKDQEAANSVLQRSIQNEIDLMVAQGKGMDEIMLKKQEAAAANIVGKEQEIKLSEQKIEGIKKESNLIDQAKFGLLNALNLSNIANIEAAKIELDKSKRIKEETQNIAKLKQDEADINNKLNVEKINNENKLAEDRKKKAEERKKEKEEEAKYNKDLEARGVEYNAEQQQKLLANKIAIDKQLQEEEDKQAQYEIDSAQQVRDKRLIIAHDIFNKAVLAYEDTRAAKKEIMDAEMANELAQVGITEEQKAQIRSKYRLAERDAQMQANANNLQAANALVSSLGDLSNTIFDIKRSNLEKGSEEDKKQAEKQFNANKAFSIAQALISGAVAVINASASVPYLPVGLASSVAASIATTATVAKIASTKFQYFDGGYTSKGNPSSEAESMGNAQFHNNEYVIPHKVLSTPKGSLIAAHAESMRKGMGNIRSGIGGFFDGGFTGRQVGSKANEDAIFQNQLSSFISMMPPQYVRVTDINNVSDSNNKAVQVSSL